MPFIHRPYISFQTNETQKTQKHAVITNSYNTIAKSIRKLREASHIDFVHENRQMDVLLEIPHPP